MPGVNQVAAPLTFKNKIIAIGDRFEITDCGDRRILSGIVHGIKYDIDWSVTGIIAEDGSCICDIGPDAVLEDCSTYCTCDGDCIDALRISYDDNRCLIVARPVFPS